MVRLSPQYNTALALTPDTACKPCGLHATSLSLSLSRCIYIYERAKERERESERERERERERYEKRKIEKGKRGRV
jgi:hypothetical protein